MDPVLEQIDDVDAAPVLVGGARVDAFVVAAYEAHSAEIHGYIARGARDPSAAEDLLQEVFLRLTREARAGRPPENVRGWLYRVASNLVISRGRRRATAVRWLGRYGAAEYRSNVAPSPEADLLRFERASEMERALARLPADVRLALLLSSAGFSGAEIAASIGRSDGATRTLLSRARVTVRRYLAAEGPE